MSHRVRLSTSLSMGLACAFLLVSACTPSVKVEAPDKPIVINLNVKIEHEARVRVEKDIDALLSQNPNLF